MLLKKYGNILCLMIYEEIYYVVEKFGDVVECVWCVGFDCVEIYVGYFYLISQFLLLLFNKCIDEFGGSVENCIWILSLIVDKVCVCVGLCFLVSLCISVDDFFKGGNIFEDFLCIFEFCQEKVDIINVFVVQNDNLNL